MENKPTTIESLNDRMWYRAIKVFYLFFFGLIALGINSAWYSEPSDVIAGNVIMVLAFLLLRGAFYYIVLGKFKPEK